MIVTLILLHILLTFVAFFLAIKSFTRMGLDVNADAAVVMLITSAIPFVGIFIGVMSYLLTLDFSANIKFFKGMK